MVMADKTVYPFGTDGSIPAGVGIINDCTTGGADKALAAEQGVVLKGLVDNSVNKYRYEAIDLSLYYGLLGNYIYMTANEWASSNATKSFFVPISPGKTYRIVANVSNGSRIAILKEKTNTTGTTPVYATGETAVRPLEANSELVFTAPSDAHYLSINYTLSNTNICPSSMSERINVVDSISEKEEADMNDLVGTWHNEFDYSEAEVVSNNTSYITIVKNDGNIVVTNVSSSSGKYALLALPESLVPGITYRIEIKYSAGFIKDDVWWFAFADSSYASTSGGLNFYPGTNLKTSVDYTHSQGNAYLRFASISQNTGAKVVIHSVLISDNKTTVSDLSNRVKSIESDFGGEDMENRIRQARFIADSPSVQPLALLHFTDIHGDTLAAKQIKDFAEKYASYIDDLVQTGDTVYYYWNSDGQGYQWYQQNGIPEALFVLGNHDGAANDNSQGWKEGTADWDFKGKEWDFDIYFADYISERGVTPPSGYDDSNSPYYKACYWHKDYASAKIRVIGLDCMHFNDGVRYTSNDQETWLAAKLAETLDSSKAAYGYSVVFLCHYPLDDYSGNNETWDDSGHRFVFNKNDGGGHIMDANTQRPVNCHYGDSFTAEAKFSMRNRVGSVGNPSYTKGANNPIGDVIKSWMDNGGKYIVWLSGHTHTEYMYYPAKYPNMLVLGLPQAGNTRGGIVADRANDSAMHSCANLIVFDTQHSQLKIVRFGKTLDRMLMKFETLCYNYGSTDRSVGR